MPFTDYEVNNDSLLKSLVEISNYRFGHRISVAFWKIKQPNKDNFPHIDGALEIVR